ncbi:MAG TPA: hypothetical protein IAC62_14030 [Candidatus Pelethocola excrementipullorum]|nr:hypothetical protein [Candidatus Pelethocola excrementipullorum]
MLNKERVGLMTKLARYEKREEKRYLKIGKYYRSDYIGIALLKNFFASTIAYILILVLIFVYQIEALMQRLNDLNIQPMIFEAVAGYIIMLAIFSGITYTVASIRYAKAIKSVEAYDGALKKLEKLYEKETQEGQHKKPGGYHS